MFVNSKNNSIELSNIPFVLTCGPPSVSPDRLEMEYGLLIKSGRSMTDMPHSQTLGRGLCFNLTAQKAKACIILVYTKRSVAKRGSDSSRSDFPSSQEYCPATSKLLVPRVWNRRGYENIWINIYVNLNILPIFMFQFHNRLVILRCLVCRVFVIQQASV